MTTALMAVVAADSRLEGLNPLIDALRGIQRGKAVNMTHESS